MTNVISNIQTQNNKRVIEIDYLKAFAIVLVVFGHFLESFTARGGGRIYQIIYLFHMPLFIFISGYLSKFKYNDLFKFGLIYLISFAAYKLLETKMFGYDFSLEFFEPYWHLWYLVSLIFWKMSLPLLDKISEKYRVLTIIALFLLGIYIGSWPIVNSYFSMQRTLAFYPFFVLGYFKRKSGTFNFNTKTKNKYIILAIVLLLTFMAFLVKRNYFSNSSLHCLDPYYGKTHTDYQRALVYILAFSMIYLLSSIKIKKENRLIRCISKNTLTTYLLHIAVVLYSRKNNLLKNEPVSILISFIISIMLVLIFTFIGWLISKIKNKFIQEIKKRI